MSDFLMVLFTEHWICPKCNQKKCAVEYRPRISHDRVYVVDHNGVYVDGLRITCSYCQYTTWMRPADYGHGQTKSELPHQEVNSFLNIQK